MAPITKKKVTNHSTFHIKRSAKGSDLAPFGDWSQGEKLFKVKPPLVTLFSLFWDNFFFKTDALYFDRNVF